MGYLWSSEIDLILRVGRILTDIGVNNWGLRREVALMALDSLLSKNVAVLGGDVYIAAAGSVKPTYDNWYCNRISSESDEEFVQRSIAKAKEYVLGYPAKQEAVLFSIVPNVGSGSDLVKRVH